MQTKNVPELGPRYWTLIVLASIFQPETVALRLPAGKASLAMSTYRSHRKCLSWP